MNWSKLLGEQWMSMILADVIEYLLDCLQLGVNETGREQLTRGVFRARFSMRCDGNRSRVHTGGLHDAVLAPD